MPPFRYLLSFSYVGTRYSGVAEQRNQPHIETVFSCLTKALTTLKEKPILCSLLGISSRTDAGVHALHNTAHIDVDFDHKNPLYTYPFDYLEDARHCSLLKCEINDILVKQNHLIRILDISKVNPNFSARHKALSRTYLYRLAVLEKPNQEKSLIEDLSLLSPFERDFCSIIKGPINLDLLLRAGETFNGHQNFSAFTTTQGRYDMMKNMRCPVKTLKIDINLNPEPNFIHKMLPFNSKNGIKMIEVELTAESFLYKMIRRIVCTMTDVAKGRLTLDTLKHIFQCPPDYYDNQNSEKYIINTLTPNGLFLKKVNYNEIDLIYTENDYKNL